MINTKDFFDYLIQIKLDFFAGVPDSLLKNLCACINDNCDANRNIISANEGNAIAIACGYHLATQKFGVVYMQNSGLGNAINPLVSLADEDVYQIPLLMLIGWRGEPDIPDEPQHKKQGKITLDLLHTMGIKTVILDDDYEQKLQYCVDYMTIHKKPIAIIIRKNTFSEYKYPVPPSDYTLQREQALEIITKSITADDIIVSTTGKTSRELFEIREKNNLSHSNDFLCVGSMGHTSSVALGISLFTEKRVFCIDGDGAFIMHMGSAAVNAHNIPDNYRYIIINNGAHESVGGQSTVGFKINIPDILRNCGFENVCTAKCQEEIISGMQFLNTHKKSAMVIYTKQGSRKNLGRPTQSPLQNKKSFMEKLNK